MSGFRKFVPEQAYNEMDLFLHVGMFKKSGRLPLRVRHRGYLVELFLQFGYGMMQHSKDLIESWNGGTVILSPRDLSDSQLRTLSKDIIKTQGGKILLDPQFYLPHADHERLCAHDFWPSGYSTGTFFQGRELLLLIAKLDQLNAALGTEGMIVPGLLAATVNDSWIQTQTDILDVAKNAVTRRPLIMTIALGADVPKHQELIAAILEAAETSWQAQAYYIVCEHPNGDYLVQDPNWLANLLDLIAGLRLIGSQTILGYCNHQFLLAELACSTSICSGTWMNVRSFPPDKFRETLDDEVKQRNTWYYCPQALSEYTIPFLDVAYRQGLISRMAPDPNVDGGYARLLFSGVQPTTVSFSERQAFRHYLHSLHSQVQSLRHSGYDESRARHEQILDNAEDLLQSLHGIGVRGRKRDFLNILDVNRAAISILDSTRGPMLRRRWSALC